MIPGRREALLESARSVCDAIMAHAQLLVEDESPRVVVPAQARIKELGELYGEEVFQFTGWSNPLQRIGEPKSPLRDEGLPPNPPVRSTWVSIIDQNAIFIEDPDALNRYICEQSHDSHKLDEDGLKWLCERDGWLPGEYPGVRLDWRSIGTCLE